MEKATIIKISSATGLPEKYLSNKQKYGRIAITYFTCIFLVRTNKFKHFYNSIKSQKILFIVVAVNSIAILRFATLLYFKDHVNAHLIAYAFGTIAIVIIITIFGVINTVVVIRLTKMEVPRTQWEFENSLVYKTFLMEFVNAFTPVFYLAFFKVKKI